MKRILVTGANGCIGSHLTRELIGSGYRVTALALNRADIDRIVDDPQVDIVFGDICDKGKMERLFALSQFEIVIHLAARVHARGALEQDYMRVNRDAAIHLFRLSQKRGVTQFIFFSTVALYGDETDRAMNENDAIQPSTPYSMAKAQAEEYMITRREGGLNCTIIRPATVYGRYDRGNINRLFKIVKLRMVPVVGDGRNLKSFVFVENLVQGVVKTINNPNAYNEIFILSDEKPYTINRIVNDMARVIGKKIFVFHIPKCFIRSFLKIFNPIGYLIFKREIFKISSIMKLTTDNIFDISKAKKILAYQPEFSLLDGLKRTYGAADNDH